MSGWLAVKFLEAGAAGFKPPKNGFYIFIPKKVIPLAVDRNRIRRLLKEAFRLDMAGSGGGKILAFRVLAKPPRAQKLNDVRQTVCGQLKKYGVA